MDVRHSGFLLLFLFLSACGDRFDVNTTRGRQASIDEANYQLSHGNCVAALNAIDPLYNSNYVNEEIVLIKASAHACSGGFNLVQLADKLATVANPFSAMAAAMPNTLNDGRIAALYTAVDVLTANNTLLSGSQRSASRNNYMIMLQLGVVGAVLHGYGAPGTTTGTQVSNLLYSNPRAGGDMSNLDACALAAALSTIVDSFSNSTMASDPNVSSSITTMNTTCATAGVGACSNLNRNRTSCTGLVADVPSVAAAAIVAGVNGAW